jgi:membrane protein
MRIRELSDLTRETVKQWRQEEITRMGAALAFCAAFSFLPMLLVATALASALFGSQKVEHQIVQSLRQVVGMEAAQTLQDAVRNITRESSISSVTTLVSSLILLVGAGLFFRHLRGSLNIIWGVPSLPRGQVQRFLWDTVLAFGAVVGTGLLLLVVLVVNTGLFVLLQSLDRVSANIALIPLWQALGVGLLFGFTFVLFAAIYKILPDAHIAWRDVWIGAALTAFLFTVGQSLIVLYLRTTTIDTIYGAGGAIVVLLAWMYVSAHLILFGAEFTQVYANYRGNKIVPTEEYEQEQATG